MASEKLFYMNRTKRKKKFWDSHYSAKGAQAFALVALWERYGLCLRKLVSLDLCCHLFPFLFQERYLSGVKR